MGSDPIAEVDPVNSTVLRRTKPGVDAHNVFSSPDKVTSYISNGLGGSITAIDPITLAVCRNYVLPGDPDDDGITPDESLWISLHFAEQKAGMNPETGTYTAIDVGRSLHRIF